MTRSTALFALVACAAFLTAPLSRAASTCSAQSAATVTPVIELYTSEGCSSCPPADRWLSHLPSDAGAVALAFHVDYWDRLGWKDRFSSAAYTRRQAEQQRVSGARFSYTPQVIVDGVDQPNWSGSTPGGAAARKAAPSVALSLSHEAGRVEASVTPLAGAPQRLAAYWAVTEDAYVSAVKSGENSGATLKHDHVVRDYQPVAAWIARPGAATALSFGLPAAADPSHPRSVALVVIDAESGRPLQALKLGC